MSRGEHGMPRVGLRVTPKGEGTSKAARGQGPTPPRGGPPHVRAGHAPGGRDDNRRLLFPPPLNVSS